MSQTGQNRLAGFLKTLTEAALVFEAAFLALSLIFYTFTVFGEGELLSAWPVHFGGEGPFSTSLTITPPIQTGNLTAHTGELSFTSTGAAYYLLKMADIIIPFGLAIWITFTLRALFASLKKHGPFLPENPPRIRKTALLLLTLFPYSIVRCWAYHTYIANHLSVPDYTIADPAYLLSASEANTLWLDMSFNFEALLAGIILLVVAEVFRTGVVIKTDNEAIV
ncbi:hypothetical protein AB9P05_01525 [Roseivirga sp. BDSF3-8]|uniref:hypothetical protein n=1 Tax=Roseivirga sp. BDSF3-8 TaxID=3241598 RepID=UPI003531B768